MYYKRLVVTFQGETKFALLMGPADSFEIRDKIRDIERRVYLAMEGENTMTGLGLASPLERIGVRLEGTSGYDPSREAPVQPNDVMIEQMIQVIKERVWAPSPKQKIDWSFKGALKKLWQNFMEFLDEFGEEARKNPDPFDNSHNWV